jgi:hypothetical protein
MRTNHGLRKAKGLNVSLACCARIFFLFRYAQLYICYHFRRTGRATATAATAATVTLSIYL